MGLWDECINTTTYERSEYHKSLLCKVREPVVEGVHFLARLGVFAFFLQIPWQKMHPWSHPGMDAWVGNLL